MISEKVSLFIQDYIHKEIKVEIEKLRVSLNPQKKRGIPFSWLTYKPLVNIAKFQEQLNGQFCYSLIFADKSRLDCIQARMGILWISLDKLPQFLVMFVEQSVEQFNPVELLVDSLYHQMGDILVLVCK